MRTISRLYCADIILTSLISSLPDIKVGNCGVALDFIFRYIYHWRCLCSVKFLLYTRNGLNKDSDKITYCFFNGIFNDRVDVVVFAINRIFP